MIEILLFILCAGVMTYICCDIYTSKINIIKKEDVPQLNTNAKDITIKCLYDKRNELRKLYLYNRNLENEKEILNTINEIDNTIKFLNSDGYIEDICLNRKVKLNKLIQDTMSQLLCKASVNMKANIIAAIYTKNVILTDLHIE